jgi:hypothetical protein
MSIEIQTKVQALEIGQQQLQQQIINMQQTVTMLTSLVEEKLKELEAAQERTGKQDGIRQGQRDKTKAQVRR